MTKKALLVGINYVGDPDNELKGCANDVTDIRKVLEENDFDTIRLLSDDIDKATKPTAKNILAELNTLVKNARSGDILFFHYSGHGTRIRDLNGDETRDHKDEAIFSVDGKVIIDDDLKKIIDKIPQGVKFFALMDCCNSATMFDLQNNTPQKPLTAKHGYAVTISGCLDPQTSADAVIRGKNNGALTACFLEQVKSMGFQQMLDTCFSNSKEVLNALRIVFVSWMKKNHFTQEPAIAHAGMLIAPVNKPILTRFHHASRSFKVESSSSLQSFEVGGRDLRMLPSRAENHTPVSKALVRLR